MARLEEGTIHGATTDPAMERSMHSVHPHVPSGDAEDSGVYLPSLSKEKGDDFSSPTFAEDGSMKHGSLMGSDMESSVHAR